MLINYKKKFIFLHNPKTAGTAIEVFFSQSRNPDDFHIGSLRDNNKITPLKFSKKMINYSLHNPSYSAIKDSIKNTCFREFIEGSNKKYFGKKFTIQPQNAYAGEIQSYFKDEWNDFFKFCVVRNPWDRIKSFYKWFDYKYLSFEEFVEKLSLDINFKEKFKGLDASNYYKIDGKICVNFIIKFEDLYDDFNKVLTKMGLSNIKNIQKYKEKKDDIIHSEKTIKIISSLCSEEINDFNYKAPILNF